MRYLFLLSIISVTSLVSSCNSEVEFSGPTRPAPLDDKRTDKPAGTDVTDDPTDEDKPKDADAIPIIERFTEEFTVSNSKQITVTKNPEFHKTTQEITLSEGGAVTTGFTQITRTLVTDSFTQGHAGTSISPRDFPISNAGKLDILIVMDDSTSMDSEATNLASKLDPLLDSIDTTDWQIGVITMSDPCLRNNRIIKKGDVDASTAFSEAILVPLSNSVVEYGFPMAIRALNEECTQWLRSDSQIAVLIVSDEDNCGSDLGENCNGDPGETPEMMQAYLESIRPVGQARIYGIVEGAGNPCGSSAAHGEDYITAITNTGGTYGSICDSDYTTTLQNISNNVNKIVVRKFQINNSPDAGSLSVKIDGVEITLNPNNGADNQYYEINGTEITLTKVIDGDSTLTVEYSYGETNRSARFSLGETGDMDTFSVEINSTSVDPNDYSIDQNTNEIVFDAEPSDDADIDVTYRKDDPLPKAFDLSGSDIFKAPKSVVVDGNATQAFTYDEQSKILLLDNSPLDGESVDVSHSSSANVVKTYLSAINDPASVINIIAMDADSGAGVSHAVNGDSLVFPQEEISESRVLHVIYELGYEETDLFFDLTEVPQTDSIIITDAGGSEICMGAIEMVNNVLVFDCGDADHGDITLRYSYDAPLTNEFTLSGEIPDDAKWTVLIDGTKNSEWDRVENTITVNVDQLSNDSIVTIKVNF
jgi:hypothetical protein